MASGKEDGWPCGVCSAAIPSPLEGGIPCLPPSWKPHKVNAMRKFHSLGIFLLLAPGLLGGGGSLWAQSSPPDLSVRFRWASSEEAAQRIQVLQQQIQVNSKDPANGERWLEIAYLYDAALHRPLEAARAYLQAARGRHPYFLYAQFRAGELLHQIPEHRKEALNTLLAFYYASLRFSPQQRAQVAFSQEWVERALLLIDQDARDKFFYRLLDVLVKLMGNFPGISHALALVLLALLLKAAFHPLMRKQYISMAKLQRIQPVLQELQRKYRNDPQKLQKAIMQTYREHQVNPLGGCLPLLIQFPLLIMVYNGIRLYIYHFHHASFLWIRNLADADLPLLVLYTMSMFVQQKITYSLNPQTQDPALQQQQRMMTLMPFLFAYMMWVWHLPSAFYFYWIAYNVLSLLEQWWVTKRYLQPLRAEPVPSAPEVSKEPPMSEWHRQRPPLTVLGETSKKRKRGRRARR